MVILDFPNQSIWKYISIYTLWAYVFPLFTRDRNCGYNVHCIRGLLEDGAFEEVLWIQLVQLGY